MQASSLYEKYGGFAQINRVVMAFYEAMVESERIGWYFDDVDMRRLIDHQTRFVSGILGGPAAFDDEILRRAHAHLGVTDAHFDEMKRLFATALSSHGFAPEDVAAVAAEIEARRRLIVR